MQFSQGFQDFVFYGMVVGTVLALMAIVVVGRMTQQLQMETAVKRAARLAQQQEAALRQPTKAESMVGPRWKIQVRGFGRGSSLRPGLPKVFRGRAGQIIFVHLFAEGSAAKTGAMDEPLTPQRALRIGRYQSGRIYRINASMQLFHMRPWKLRR